jgi:hypothetical protein
LPFVNLWHWSEKFELTMTNNQHNNVRSKTQEQEQEQEQEEDWEKWILLVSVSL